MTDQENGYPKDQEIWSELKLPQLLFNDRVQQLHAEIEREWNSLQRSACQTAAGRGLWKHVTNDSLAELLAGETYLRSFYEKIRKDCLNNAREVSGVILAVRTLWFDSKLQAALTSFNTRDAQIVLLGAGMDTRAYRLSYLTDTDIFEVDFPEVLQMKNTLLQAASEYKEEEEQKPMLVAKSLTNVAADVRTEDWIQKLKDLGFVPERNTVWILEGLLYYFHNFEAMGVLETIANFCTLTQTVVLADFMNEPSITLSTSTFHFHSDWPDKLLQSLGFSDVKLSQIGDPDADFGLMHDPENLFNKLRSIPRAVHIHPDNGTPCCRLYLVQASGSPTTYTPQNQ